MFELWFEELNAGRTATGGGTMSTHEGRGPNDEIRYAERMFPAPVDLGIAQPDRAVSSVRFGTESYLAGRGGEGKLWYEGGGSKSDRAVQNITIYPPTHG